MGNLTKNTITRGAVIALALSAGAATTANAAVTRTFGADRFSTATEIFKAWPTTADTAILAAGVGHDVDALTVAPLAKMKNAPIILVDTNDTTTDIVAKFAAFKTVYIANGTGVISQVVETALAAVGKTVIRLGGTTRTDTALKIAKVIGATNGIVVANGDDPHIVDTLSIASIAAAKGMPIFLTTGGSLDAAELAYAKGLAVTTVYALGGTTVVTDATVAGLGTLTRLAGPDRYSTNAAVVTNFKSSLDLNNIYIASGEDENLIDALAGAPLAGLKNSPIVFAHNSLSADVSTFLNNVVNAKTNLTILGGTGAVSDAVSASLTAVQAAHSNLAVASVTATNSKTLVVKFTQPVLDTTVIASLIVKNITVTPVADAKAITNSTLAATLSSDGLTLTLTPSAAEYFGGNYALTVSTLVTDKSANAITAYSAIFSASDTTRPSVTGPTYAVNGKAHFTFSEPINVVDGVSLATVMAITDQDGAAVVTTGLVTLATDKASFDLNITGFIADKNYAVTILGLSDFAGNLMTPNPTIVTVKNLIVDNTIPTVVSIVPTSLNAMKITFSENLRATSGVIANYLLDGANAVNINTTIGGNATLDATGTIATVTIAPAVASGVHNVTVTGYSDLSLNGGISTTKLVSFVADTTAPTFISSQAITIGSDQYLVVKYSKNVVVNPILSALSGTYVDASTVTKAFGAIDANIWGNVTIYDPLLTGASDSVKIKITSLLSGIYTANISGLLIKDTTIPANAAAGQTVTFTLGTFVDSTSPSISSVIAQASEDVVTIVFDRDVTAATALNIGNYAVEGVNVFKSAIFDGDARTVKLTLSPNTIALTGNRLFAINNIATSAGKTMAAYNSVQLFKENVKPTLVSAAFTNATTIIATFNEAVTGAGTGDFEFYIDGVKQTTTNASPTVSKTVTITIAPITDLSKAFTIKYVGSDLKDGASTPNTAPASAVIAVTH